MSPKKCKYVSRGPIPDVKQPRAVQHVKLNPNQEGVWEVTSKKNKNGTGTPAATKQWAAQALKPNPCGSTGGRGNGKGMAPSTAGTTGGRAGASNQPANRYYENPNAIPPRLRSGWNWNSRPGNPWQARNNVSKPQQWTGLKEVVIDKEIVWPPMVVIMNTQLDLEKNHKWLGMGNQQLLDYFGSYAAVRAGHSYGPKGHRGMGVLIFEASAVGYIEAERLGKHFECEGIDRNAWDRRPHRFHPVSERRLYGFMATKRDMEIFNLHSRGKSKLKFQMVSYQEKVVTQLKQMNEDNKQLNWYKNKAVKEKKHSKALEASYSQKLRQTEQQTRLVRARTRQYHQQKEEEMNYLEQIYKDYVKIILDIRNAKEEQFEKLPEARRTWGKQSYSALHPKMRDVKLREMEELEEEGERLLREHDEKIVDMKCRHRKEEIELEKELNTGLTRLMDR